MRTQFIRTATKRLDTFHSASYFSPITAAEYDALGLSRSAQYFAARSCALGAASAELVAATFFSFNPERIAAVVPECWQIAPPTEVHEARIRGVRTLLATLEAALEASAATELRQAAIRTHRNLAPVIGAQPISGRPLYAAHLAAFRGGLANSTEDVPLLDLWVTTTLLREYRGDGHIAALVAHGLSGLEASVLDCATGRAWRPSSARRSRGWSEDAWRAAAGGLAARGLLSDESDASVLTESGLALKETLETATDRSVHSAWSVIDDDTLEEVRQDAKLIAGIVVEAGLLPQKLFGREPAPSAPQAP